MMDATASSEEQRHSQQEHQQQVISERKIRAVTYNTENHIEVLTQLHGSVWPRVIPYCIVNILVTCVIYYLRAYRGIDLTFSDRGHTFMSLMVSFLVVTRSNIAYARFMEAREDLTRAMRACRELTQHMITFTRYESSARARQWRAEISRRTVVLLRTTVSVLEYDTRGVHAWKVPELTKDEKQALLMSVGRSNERTPMVLTVFLRSAIASHVEYLRDPMHVNKELRLYAFVSDFVAAYHGLMKLVTTPFPFPLVQMARTFLFLWVFTIPFALADDIEQLPALLMITFFVTYGFIGLEFVSIELDDPFGDDPNDFDVLGLARVVFEDIYIAVYDIDGREAAANLKRSIEAPLAQMNKALMVESDGGKAGGGGGGAQTHRRYNSIDLYRNSAPAPEIRVGTDRSRLLLAMEQSSTRSITLFGSPKVGGLKSVSESGNTGGAGAGRGSSGSGCGLGGLDLSAIYAPSHGEAEQIETSPFAQITTV